MKPTNPDFTLKPTPPRPTIARLVMRMKAKKVAK